MPPPINGHMMRTMQDWTSVQKKKRNDNNMMMQQEQEIQQNQIVDEGVQKYIISQQDKRKKVQTGYVRKLVNNS